MKVYQIKGLELYTVAFSKEDAVATFWVNRIGLTEKDIIETDLLPDRENIGRVYSY